MNIDLKMFSLVASGAILLGGCQHLAFTHVYDEFEGLCADKSFAIRSTACLDKSLDILVIHGMGHAMEVDDPSYNGYSVSLQQKLVSRLGWAPSPVLTDTFPIHQGGIKIGSVVHTRYPKTATGSELTFYELSWAEAVKPLKIALLELGSPFSYREENSPLEQKRAPLNSKAKAFLNTHLSDPVIYSGELGAILRRDVDEAICIMTRVDPEPGPPCDFNAPEKPRNSIAMVSISLGSTIVFDAVY